MLPAVVDSIPGNVPVRWLHSEFFFMKPNRVSSQYANEYIRERDGGCGFGDAVPNDDAAKALTA